MTLKTPILTTLILFMSLCTGIAEDKTETSSVSYKDLILQDEPIGYWRFEEDSNTIINHSNIEKPEQLNGVLEGRFEQKVAGPTEPEFQKLPLDNLAIKLKSPFGQVKIADPGENSLIDFNNGDALTIEAWVKPHHKQPGGYVYILGKGRSSTSGEKSLNQNYSLRLTPYTDGKGNTKSFGLSFLFRTTGEKGDWHRWTTNDRLTVGDGWHHIAMTYKFGDPKSMKAYLDGESSKGRWDKAKTTKSAPVVDNDDLIIGSAMNKHPATSYLGDLDEVVLYKKILTKEQIQKRYQYQPKDFVINWDQIPENQLQVDIYEYIQDRMSWKFRSPKKTDTFYMDHFAFPEIPEKYSAKGIQIDRTSPFLMSAMGKVKLPEGKLKFLLRARNASRLFIDNKLVLETDFHRIVGTAHGKVDEKDYRLTPDMPQKTRGDRQAVAEIEGDGKIHQIRFEMIVGGRNHRFDTGETVVCFSDDDKTYHVLSPEKQPVIEYTFPGWKQYLTEIHTDMHEINATRRREFSKDEDLKWNQKHEQDKKEIAKLEPIEVPAPQKGFRANNAIDQFINTNLSVKKLNQSDSLSDLEFLRKLALDTQGTVPTLEQINEFLNDNSPDKRKHAIDRFLEQDQWADHWVGYWQDVLAENPNIVNPTLNNTGPFRWWIHESFYDNKPFDRFVSELVLMEGSSHFGGPAGFEMASQNDVPYAAKAHIIGQAFLALNMKCARCHDAPFRDFKQKDLFSIAAMLKGSAQEVPKTSSIPGFDPKTNSMMVQVTLKPGEKVLPDWPFKNLAHTKEVKKENKQTSREELTELLTAPSNSRFSQVIVNRVWKRYLGAGLIEPVDDWTDDSADEYKLLNYLSREFVKNGYDLKHLSRLIFQSDLYQRKAEVDFETVDKMNESYHFASPVYRRMEAEQIVDSLFTITGKPFNAGQMSLDIDGSRTYKLSTHFGTPRRAWEFISSSNERDRPSLALPFAEPFLNLMSTFGWRATRQEPVSVRDKTSTARQPAIMANGTLSQRFTKCSDDSSFTELALADQPIDELVESVYLKILTRHPTDEERDTLVTFLTEGYENRKTGKPAKVEEEIYNQNRVSWSNHAHGRANEIKVELKHLVQKGDPVSEQLTPEWRERYEDMLWAMWNSPEFLYTP